VVPAVLEGLVASRVEVASTNDAPLPTANGVMSVVLRAVTLLIDTEIDLPEPGPPMVIDSSVTTGVSPPASVKIGADALLTIFVFAASILVMV